MMRRCEGNTPSIFYVPDFISGADEQQLLERIHAQASSNEWVTLRSRRLKCWGGQPGESFRPEPLPPWVDALCESLVARGVFSEETRPNHVLLNGEEERRWGLLGGALGDKGGGSADSAMISEST